MMAEKIDTGIIVGRDPQAKRDIDTEIAPNIKRRMDYV